MQQQELLPETDPRTVAFKLDSFDRSRGEVQYYALFLAVVPDEKDAPALGENRDALCNRPGLAGSLVSTNRLHITLFALATYAPTGIVPLADVEAARAAASGIVCGPLDITFVCAMSFAGSNDKNPLVWRCDQRSDGAIAELRGRLKLPLRAAGLHPQETKTPHITLMYSRRLVAEQTIRPLHWTARRFALILSHHGIGHHQWVQEWPLCDSAVTHRHRREML